jgi:2,4-dienoyl-CoA reductase (NADPH2)
MSELKSLFEPIQVGQMSLKNRIVMPGLGLCLTSNGKVSEDLSQFYAERAHGGAGLIVFLCSPTYFSESGTGAIPLITEDESIPGLKQMVDIIHAGGAMAAAQLSIWPMWARTREAPVELVAPCDLPMSQRPGAPVPRSLTQDEIRQLVDLMGEGTRRARDAGFDAVELHALGGESLPSQFISPLTNQRSDGYGGSLEKRYRFLLEIIDAAKAKAGKDYTIMCRLSGDEFVEGGATIEDTLKAVPLLEEAGIQALNISTGWFESRVPFIQPSVPPGAFVYLGENVKKVTKVPVIGGTRINEARLADQILAEGRVDLIYMARALIADPELPNKAREGRFNDVRQCVACGYCLERALSGQPVACSVNPRAGREREYIYRPADKPKRILVIGGGPAGMEAARVAAQKGHRVALWEKGDRLGGQLLVADMAPYKDDIASLSRHLEAQVRGAGIEIRLKEEATIQAVKRANPDAVIVATGATPFLPDIPGAKGNNVAGALDVLAGLNDTGDRVVIVGGRMIGCEVAELLALRGKQVTLLARRERMADDVGPTSRWVLMQRLRGQGVVMETKVDIREITDKGAKGIREGEPVFFEADTIVLATGMRSNRKLAEELQAEGMTPYPVGDCVEPRRVRHAIEEGFRCASQI